MGLGIYEQSLFLLFTNASEDLTTKLEAREGALHYKTYSIGQNKRSSRKPLHSGHLQITDTGRLSQAVRYMEVPLYVQYLELSEQIFYQRSYTVNLSDLWNASRKKGSKCGVIGTLS